MEVKDIKIIKYKWQFIYLAYILLYWILLSNVLFTLVENDMMSSKNIFYARLISTLSLVVFSFIGFISYNIKIKINKSNIYHIIYAVIIIISCSLITWGFKSIIEFFILPYSKLNIIPGGFEYTFCCIFAFSFGVIFAKSRFNTKNPKVV
ncbi:MAG: hypothetical protein ACERKV_00775 [Clostridiaceae bacterium]